MKPSLWLPGACGALALGLFLASAPSASAAFSYTAGNTLGSIVTIDDTGTNYATFFADSIAGPPGMAFDSAGNLYLPNPNANTIAKITTNNVTTMFVIDPGDDSVLANPQGVAFDKSGNLYVANGYNDNVEVITPAGVASVFVTDPGDGSVLNGPTAVAFDSAGNLYVANATGGSGDFIEKFTTNGTASQFAADPGDGSVLNSPIAMAFDKSGNLYVVNNEPPAFIEKFDSAGMPSPFVTNGLNFPTGLAIDSSGNIDVVDQALSEYTSTVTKYQTNGIGTVIISNLFSPDSICFDNTGHIVVADFDQIDIFPITTGPANHLLSIGVDMRGLALDNSSNLYVANFDFGYTVSKITPAGVGTVWANFNTPVFDVVIDGAGNGYATLSDANQIMKITPGGATSVFAVDPGTSNVLNSPAGIAIDSAGNLYVANQLTNNIVKFTPSGTPGIFASTGANFGYGVGLAIDKSNNVYAEYGDSILKFAQNGSYVIFATDPGDNSVLDGPEGMGFDSAGNLYVANYNSGTIEKFTTNGTPSRFSDDSFVGAACITLAPSATATLLPPFLHIAQSGTNAVLSWAVSSGLFYLQSTPSLHPTNWTTLSNITPAVVGTNYVETNGVSGTAKYYRLISQ